MLNLLTFLSAVNSSRSHWGGGRGRFLIDTKHQGLQKCLSSELLGIEQK